MIFKKQDGKQSPKKGDCVSDLYFWHEYFLSVYIYVEKLDVSSEKKLLYYFCYTYLLLCMALHWQQTGTMQRRKYMKYCLVFLMHHFQHCNRQLQVIVQQANGQLFEPEQ
jgi:hypothetical protein